MHVINPDIHGRKFWKYVDEWANIPTITIFLGDYLDPYPREEITKKSAIENFKEIIQFKKDNPENVVLLLGNHDLAYISPEICSCRCDSVNYPEIQNLFKENWDLFQMFYKFEDNGKKFLCSHAGIADDWINYWYKNNSPEEQLKHIERECTTLFEDEKAFNHFERAMAEVSFWRGGFSNIGSLVWRDADEPLSDRFDFQIFGHTLGKANIYKNGACLDCKRAFLLNKNKIQQVDGKEYTLYEV